MRRRTFLGGFTAAMALRPFPLVAGMLASPPAASAEQAAKIFRIGALWAFSPAHSLGAFRQALRDLGYVEGQNIALEDRYAQGKDELLPALAAELVRLKVDVIVTVGELPIRAARQATNTIPIVMVISGDPVATGLIASLARPGGNITGLTILSTELSAKRLEVLKEAFPKASRVAVLWNPANASNASQLKATLDAARRLGLTGHPVEVQRANDLETALARERGRADSLIVLADNLISESQRRILELARKNQLPAMYPWRHFVDAGGLMSYGPRSVDMYRRAATFVDKILKGAKPADLPVEQPNTFELVINLKTAWTLGLTIPPTLLVRADEVLE